MKPVRAVKSAKSAKAKGKKVLKRTETRKTAPKRAENKTRVNLYPLGAKTQRRAIVEALINRESMTGREMQAQLGIMCYTKRISEINDLTQLTNVGIIKSWKKVRTRWGNGFTRVAEYHLVEVGFKTYLTTRGKRCNL